MEVQFSAPDYHADASFGETRYRFEGDVEAGWQIERNGQPHLRLGPGYQLLDTQQCGVCSTDLARQFLPFPLPQVTGHELLARDAEGQRCSVEINASHLARGVAPCAFCRGGLAHHCPERLVLGIHDLLGGFGPHVLAPVHAIVRLPAELPDASAVLLEPFAAALNAVQRVAPRPGERVAVLGPRRLGMLVVAALAAWRRKHGIDFSLLAIARHEALRELALRLGADEARPAPSAGAAPTSAWADVVIDTTGSPEGLALALALAGREVHIKSTHGQPALGLRHLTELVVDEIGLLALPEEPAAAALPLALAAADGKPRLAWLAAEPPPPALAAVAELRRGTRAESLLAELERERDDGGLPRVDVAVVDHPAAIDAVLRPREGSEASLVRPRGEIWLRPAGASTGLAEALGTRGLRLSSSRCGDFAEALALMQQDAELNSLGERLISHRFAAREIERAFEVARSPSCIKAVIEHPSSA